MRICRFAFGECSSLTLPPEGDDAISPHSPLRPTRKSFAFALRTAASRPVGASEQESVASRCATAAAAFVATHSFNGWRCCPIPPLYKVLLRQRLLAPFYTASKRVTIIGFCPTERCTRIVRLRQSGFVANGTRRLTFFASPSTADNGTAVRAVAGRGRNRILRQLLDLYSYATPHSLRSTVSAPSPGL